MKQLDLQKLIDELKNSIPISQIEKEVGMPTTTLQKSLKYGNSFPKKWVQPLRDFIASKISPIPNTKKVVLIEDENGNLQTIDGKKCRLEWVDENKPIIAAPIKEQAKDKPPVTRSQPAALKEANDALEKVSDDEHPPKNLKGLDLRIWWAEKAERDNAKK